MAATNICRGNTISADIIKITLKNQKKTLLTTTVIWGSFADVVYNAEKWRRWFGSSRYIVWGFKQIFLQWKFKTYKANIKFKTRKEKDSGQVGETLRKETDENLGEFESLDQNNFTFVAFVSHECRSSNDDSILAPFTRFKDQKLNFVSVNANNRCGLVNWMAHARKGNHLKLNSFMAKRASECIIKPETHSYFNIDGEIYDNDEAHIAIKPKFLTLIGKLFDKTNDQQQYADEIDINKSCWGSS